MKATAVLPLIFIVLSLSLHTLLLYIPVEEIPEFTTYYPVKLLPVEKIEEVQKLELTPDLTVQQHREYLSWDMEQTPYTPPRRESTTANHRFDSYYQPMFNQVRGELGVSGPANLGYSSGAMHTSASYSNLFSGAGNSQATSISTGNLSALPEQRRPAERNTAEAEGERGHSNALFAPDGFTKPSYPAIALRYRLEGVVKARVEILEDGSIGNVQIVQSSGHSVLDNCVVQTINRYWKFIPAQDNNNPIKENKTFSFQFIYGEENVRVE